jgi:hypothetical protein
MLHWLHDLLPRLPHYGYFSGKEWKRLEAWLGPASLYLVFAGLALLLLGVIFRHSLSGFWARHGSKRGP